MNDGAESFGNEGTQQPASEKPAVTQTQIPVVNESPSIADGEIEVKRHDLFLYKTDCLSCSHLIKTDKVKTKPYRCTGDNGNKRCPAILVQIGIGANVEKIASSIYSARHKNDLKAYARRLERLAGYPESVQARVMTRVDELVSASKTV